MKRSACLYGPNNGVGLLADISLVQDLLFDHYTVDISYTQNSLHTLNNISNHIPITYDVGVFFQEYDVERLNLNKKNILIVNEEWLRSEKIEVLQKFDKIITKSTLGKELLRPYNNHVVNCGFISKDRYDSNIIKQEQFLHVMGKSSQKGTEHVLTVFANECKEFPVTVIESRNDCTIDADLKQCFNFNYIKDFITEEDINIEYNKHLIHLCPSYYEAWGHYVYEGLSTGALLYVTKIPMFLEWLDPDLVVFLDCEFDRCDNTVEYFKYRDNMFPYQFGWKPNQVDFNFKIKNYKQYLENHKPHLVRKYFKHLNQQNSKKLLNELTDI